MNVPETINSSQAKLVYLYIRNVGQATADEISSALNLTKLTVLNVLNSMRERNLILKKDEVYKPQL